MDDANLNRHYELLCMIVNHGHAGKVMKVAKQHGITGCTVFLGNGTIKNRILEFLEINDIRKEIILTIAEKSVIRNAADIINKEFEFHKPRHGIAFIIDVANFIGARGCIYNKDRERVGVEKTMYNSIFTVVEKGKAEEVIEAAQKRVLRVEPLSMLEVQEYMRLKNYSIWILNLKKKLYLFYQKKV